MLHAPGFLEVPRIRSLGFEVASPLSDNSGAESVCKKLYTSKVPLKLFVRKLAMWSSVTGTFLDCSHIAGEKNEDADWLSRRDGTAALPGKFLLENRIQLSLEEFWNVSFKVSLLPSDALAFATAPLNQLLNPAGPKV